MKRVGEFISSAEEDTLMLRYGPSVCKNEANDDAQVEYQNFLHRPVCRPG